MVTELRWTMQRFKRPASRAGLPALWTKQNRLALAVLWRHYRFVTKCREEAMKLGWKAASAGLALALVAGCSSPDAKINQSCRAGGGSAAACDCFVGQLKTALTPQQLAVLANSMETSRQDNQAAAEQAAQTVQQELGMEGAMKVAGAAKQCEVSTMQGL
jgi:outer membrane murein-binding lipoprotein Lpp